MSYLNPTAGKAREAPIEVAGAPVAGTDEVWTLTIGGTPNGGTFTLKFGPYTTGSISWSATNNTLRDNVDAALEALPNVGSGGVTTAVGTMTAGVGTLTITGAGALGKKALGKSFAVAANNLTGTSPTVVIAKTTPGVNASGRGAGTGQLLKDTTNGILYQNTGTANAPTWTKVGTET